MMIVKERSFTAVLAAFAWIALVYLWQAGALDSDPHQATIDASQASHTEPAAPTRVATLPDLTR